MRADMKERALILARDSYLGAQHNGTIFWSSDISPNWDTLKRQVPTGINFTASGMPYWSTDIGGWQGLPYTHTPAHPPLLDPSDARDNVGHYDDYPELYTRWFEYRSEEHTSELQSLRHLVCRLLLEKKQERAGYVPSVKSV